MKYILFLIVSISIYKTNSAQLEKKTWLMGGNGSFFKYTEESSVTGGTVLQGKFKSSDIVANIGYFPIDKLSIGLRPFFNSYKGTFQSGGLSDYNRYGAGPFIRYYLLERSKQFNLLFDFSYLLGVNNQKGNGNGKYNTFKAMGGVELFFNSSVGIELLFGYKAFETTSTLNSITVRNKMSGFQAMVGFQFHLQKE